MTVFPVCVLTPGLKPGITVDRVASLFAALEEWKSDGLPALLPAAVAVVLAPL